MEEIPGEGNAPDIDAAGYTGRVAPEDLLDQEKLDQALADGWRTADIAGPGESVIGTRKMGEVIRANI